MSKRSLLAYLLSIFFIPATSTTQIDRSHTSIVKKTVVDQPAYCPPLYQSYTSPPNPNLRNSKRLSGKDHNFYFIKRFWAAVDEYMPALKLYEMDTCDLILFFGKTGVGKSTLINTWLGHHVGIEEKKENFWKKVKNKINAYYTKPSILDEMYVPRKKITIRKKLPNVAFTEIGHQRFLSQTTLPTYCAHPSNGLAYLDCAGFNDTRGEEYNLLNLLVLHLFIQKATAVKAVITLVSYSSLFDTRGGTFLQLLHQVNDVVDIEYHADNLFWFVVKAPDQVTDSDLLDILEKLSNQRGDQKNEFKKSYPDRWQKIWHSSLEKKEHDMLEKIIASENVYVIDPLVDQGSYEEMHQELTSPSTTLPKGAFPLQKIGNKIVNIPLKMKEIFLSQSPLVAQYLANIQQESNPTPPELSPPLKPVEVWHTHKVRLDFIHTFAPIVPIHVFPDFIRQYKGNTLTEVDPSLR